MKFVVCNSVEETSVKAAEVILDTVKTNPEAILGLATGSSPLGIYDNMAKSYEAGETDFSKVRTFNLDEYWKIDRTDINSYYRFMFDNLFSRINIDPKNVRILDGMCDDPEKECAEYEEAINNAGGIDLQLLGIGRNGHIAFNEPCSEIPDCTHVQELTEATIKDNARFFATIDEVPTKALTMGIGSIMRARKIVLIATGANKSEAIAKIKSGEITPETPATLLRLHPDVTIFCDKEAYGTV